MNPSVPCHICGKDALRPVAGFSQLPRVTSDCKPYPAGGALALCGNCGTAQKVVTPAWREEIAAIYDAYAIYEQAGGEEQAVFDQSTGAALRRSERLLDGFAVNVSLGEHGTWLDVGCGNGAMLRAVADRYAKWRLSGTELGDTNRAAVQSIAQVEAFHAGPIAEIDKTYDVVSMIHVLEHVENPLSFLGEVKALMAPGAVLLIQLPYWEDNPFDLMIADHCTHFLPDSLQHLLQTAGFTCRSVASGWVSREISAVAMYDDDPGKGPGLDISSTKGVFDAVQSRVSWLRSVRADIERLSGEGPLGVFGSSIGAAFAYGAADGQISFFVDEDKSRIGREHLGRPIVGPGDIQAGVRVYIPLPPQLAAPIASRLDPDGHIFILPPRIANGGRLGSEFPQ